MKEQWGGSGSGHVQQAAAGLGVQCWQVTFTHLLQVGGRLTAAQPRGLAGNRTMHAGMLHGSMETSIGEVSI